MKGERAGMRTLSTGPLSIRPASLRQALVARPGVAMVAAAVAGIGVLTASAWLSVPFYPVPLTMQTLAVLLTGGLLGPRLGVASVAGYLALGLTGAPVFHGGTGGPAVLLGPTGGYLLGFLPAAFLMGLAASRARSSRGRVVPRRPLVHLLVLSAGALLAEAAVYALGVPWLALAYLGGSLGRAATAGFYPYLLGDLLKASVAIGAIRLGSGRLGSWGSLLPR